MKYSKKGFTLAEILVTLGVIGVIASMTVPTLVQDIQDAQYKTVWKKTFADFSQATDLLIQEKAGSLKGVFTGFAQHANIYSKYFNSSKVCNVGETQDNCWIGTVNWAPTVPGIRLNNGVMILFYDDFSSNCSLSLYGKPLGQTYCTQVWFDVNGFKGPNKAGKDWYGVYVLESRILPYGVAGSEINNGTTYGRSCPDGIWCNSMRYLSQ